MKFSYTAFDRTGKAVSSTVEARDAADASDTLHRQGLFVTEMGPASVGGGGSGGGAHVAVRSGRRGGAGKRMRNLAMFTRQLYVLLSTGTPMVEALTALERQTSEPHWRSVVAGIRGKVEDGVGLSAAMASYPHEFDAVCRSLVAAGESGGDLDVMLDRCATLAKRQLHTRTAIVGAMVYPALLVVVANVVMVVLLTFVLPRFAALFKSLSTPLPPTTKILMELSDLLRTYWWAIPVVGVGGFMAIRLWLATPAGKRSFDSLTLMMPQIGAITRNFITARIVRLLGVLIQGKVPLVEALELTRQSTGNHHYTQLIIRAADGVTRGESLSSAFSDSRLVVPSVHEAMRSGERSGQLGPLLNTIADFLDEENEVTLRSLTSILEPMILIVLGVFVGIVAISMFMPLFDLTAATHG
jgi:type II secretory pathway component PulF